MIDYAKVTLNLYLPKKNYDWVENGDRDYSQRGNISNKEFKRRILNDIDCIFAYFVEQSDIAKLVKIKMVKLKEE